MPMPKKTMLLAGMALAAIAFAAPTAQAEPVEWWIHTESGEETLEGTEELHAEGALTLDVILSPSFTYVLGPCNYTFEGVAENVEGMASGAVTRGNISGFPCNSNVPGCTVKNASLSNFNWPLTATTSGSDIVDIEGFTFTNIFNGCSAFDFLGEFNVAGTVTGEATTEPNAQGESCINLNSHVDHMTVEGSNVPVDVTGEICIANPLTLK